VFFSLSLGVGVMTTYSSYNQEGSNILRSSFIVALTDTVLSFLSGFFIFGIVGYLRQDETLVFADYMGGSVLLYGTVPYALEVLSASNLWSVLFYLTIFLLGIDSSISYVETVVTALLETGLGKKTNRLGITIATCLVGFLISIAFCANFANNLISATDYFLSAYFITFVAIVECMSIGWIFDFQERIVENNELADPLIYLTGAYWGGLFCFGILGYWVFFDYNYIAIVCFLVLLVAVIFYTKHISKLSWGDYYEKVLMNGVHRFANGISCEGGKKPNKATKAFEIWFGISIKYFIPAALIWMLMMSIKFMGDIGKDNYEYPADDPKFRWQYVGMLFPIVGFFFFAIPVVRPAMDEAQQAYVEEKVEREFASD